MLLAAFSFFWRTSYDEDAFADDDWRLSAAASSLGRRGIVRWRSNADETSGGGREFVGRRRVSGAGKLVFFSGIRYAKVPRRFAVRRGD